MRTKQKRRTDRARNQKRVAADLDEGSIRDGGRVCVPLHDEFTVSVLLEGLSTASSYSNHDKPFRYSD